MEMQEHYDEFFEVGTMYFVADDNMIARGGSYFHSFAFKAKSIWWSQYNTTTRGNSSLKYFTHPHPPFPHNSNIKH